MDPEQNEAIANAAMDRLGRIADSLERIAAADERRNELLVEDRDERRKAIEREAVERAEILDSIRQPPVVGWPLNPAELERVTAAEEEARRG